MAVLFRILTSPIGISNRIETSNLLTTGIILDKRHIARDIDLALFLSDILFLLRNRLRTISATVMNYIIHITKEYRVTMKMHIPVFRLVPLRVQQQVLGIQ